jgi:hypothetical protein
MLLKDHYVRRIVGTGCGVRVRVRVRGAGAGCGCGVLGTSYWVLIQTQNRRPDRFFRPAVQIFNCAATSDAGYV